MITVIITTYKRSDFLKNAIESVLKQTYTDYEILVIDDNGDDSTERKKVEKLMKNYLINEKIKYLKYEKNMGACYARNYGIKHSKGEYIAFLDDDDEFYQQKLEKLYNIFIKNNKNNIGVVCSRMDIFESTSNKKIRKSIFNGKENQIYNLFDYLSGKVIIQGTSTLMFPTKILREIGGFTEIPSHQEAYLIATILKRGYYGMVCNESLVKYRDHSIDKKSIGSGKNALIGKMIYDNYKLELIKSLKSKYERDEAMFYYKYGEFCYLLSQNTNIALLKLKEMISYRILKKENLKAIIKLILLKLVK